MGAIMCMGVATANSILVVAFAKERLAITAMLSGGARSRRHAFRPVIMTALAMIIGMVPMALGAGDGGEQNAPLGRAVIGGLMLCATVATLVLCAICLCAAAWKPQETRLSRVCGESGNRYTYKTRRIQMTQENSKLKRI